PTGESEYVELYNSNAFAVDLSGWQIDDQPGAYSAYTIPPGTLIQPTAVLLFQRTFGLNNNGDQVRLLAPNGQVRDAHAYDGNPGKGVAWSRYPDGIGPWRSDLPPSPGQPNPAPPTLTPTPTPTSTPTPIPNGVFINCPPHQPAKANMWNSITATPLPWTSRAGKSTIRRMAPLPTPFPKDLLSPPKDCF
ncbi:MAG: lamin tail domain-containing protein, partial [Chloroflexi bacterium]|nr:lamin tail domain-containing protein [Chloroflexota bacterium]